VPSNTSYSNIDSDWRISVAQNIPGAYILENTPPRGKISRCHLGEKLGKGKEKKGGIIKEKGRKGK
jgi:hypothetical protein